MLKFGEYQLALIEDFANYFSSSGPGSLQNFWLNITHMPNFFPFMIYQENWRSSIRQTLEYNLSSLRHIRVLKTVRIKLQSLQYVFSNWNNMRETNGIMVNELAEGMSEIAR